MKVKFFKIFYINVCLFCFLTSLSASNYEENRISRTIQCAPQIQSILRKIQKIPEANDLICFIQKEGNIEIIVKNTSLSKQFGAFWDPDERVICIALSNTTCEGSIAGSILFELFNASVNSQFHYLNGLAKKRQISKKEYIRSMEYLEYLNSLGAAKIARIGIQMRLLPKNAELPTYPTFEEHFLAQKKAGHSACFARNYENLLNESI